MFSLKFGTFDWYIVENVFHYLSFIAPLKDLVSGAFVWSFILLSIFLKCGIAPFFLWKPAFFNGIPIQNLFFYVSFFYFFIFLFFLYFLLNYFSFIFYFYIYVPAIFIFFGLFITLSLLFESFYLQVFIAISSILNSLLILLTVLTSHSTTFNIFF